MAVFVVVVVLILASVIAIQIAAAGQAAVQTSAPPDRVFAAAQGAFFTKMTEFGRSGNEMTIRPKLKKDAPTMTVTVSNGTATVWWSKWTSHYAGPLPTGRGHALWVLRKKLKIAWAIRALEPTAAAAPSDPARQSEG